MKLLHLSPFLYLLIVSCTKHSYERIIENNSSYDIWLKIDRGSCNGFDLVTSSHDSVLVLSQTSFTVDAERHSGILASRFTSCVPCIDTIHTQINGHDSLNLRFPITTDKNWEMMLTNNHCECKLTLEDSDIN
ncbi:hypothetical protein [Aureispira anguillae]|uniref:Lipoprotein n=1 Tax=Aureispira anguillae TaxID=2864201 RepID=A0A916DQU8_9BACT|nr:hypothetical protein [Aureispira anguillae]BDS11394.1 hypothetical protein AsAng_0021080 [Aureispira anguillae]